MRAQKGERELPDEERFAITAKQGRPVFGCEMKIIDDAGNDLPQDGSVSGNGTIVWSGKTNKAYNMAFGGTEEAEVAKVADTETKTEATVTTTTEGTASATAKDTETGATTAVTVEANADAAVTAPQ